MPQKLSNNLVVAFRYRGNVYEPDSVEAYVKHLLGFSPLKIICATEKGNSSIPVMEKLGVEVIEYKDFKNRYYVEPIREFYKIALNHHLLIISFGVELEKWQLEHGFDFLRSKNLLSVGWRINSQENDGSYLGRLSYNTCLLHEPGYYQRVMEAGDIPEYVENQSLGNLSLKLENGNNEIRIGGQEDLAVQLRVYRSLIGKKHKLFGHIKHYGIDYLEEPPENSSFNEKIIRKVITAEVYRKVEDVDPRDFLDSWVII